MLLEFHDLNYIHLLLWSKCQEFFPVLCIGKLYPYPYKENERINEINDKKHHFWRTGFDRQKCQAKLLKDGTMI